MLDELFKQAAGLSDMVLIVGMVLVFTMQLLKYTKETKEKKATTDANQGVNHFSIYEKLQTQDKTLAEIHKNLVESREESQRMWDVIARLENDFRAHTQTDTEMSLQYLDRLARIDRKLETMSTPLRAVGPGH